MAKAETDSTSNRDEEDKSKLRPTKNQIRQRGLTSDKEKRRLQRGWRGVEAPGSVRVRLARSAQSGHS
jgi:hypothetical protein